MIFRLNSCLYLPRSSTSSHKNHSQSISSRRSMRGTGTVMVVNPFRNVHAGPARGQACPLLYSRNKSELHQYVGYPSEYDGSPPQHDKSGRYSAYAFSSAGGGGSYCDCCAPACKQGCKSTVLPLTSDWPRPDRRYNPGRQGISRNSNCKARKNHRHWQRRRLTESFYPLSSVSLHH